MYIYNLTLTNGDIYLVKSRDKIDKILKDLDEYEWVNFLLADEVIAGYMGNKAIKKNVVVFRTDNISTIGYYIDSSMIGK